MFLEKLWWNHTVQSAWMFILQNRLVIIIQMVLILELDFHKCFSWCIQNTDQNDQLTSLFPGIVNSYLLVYVCDWKNNFIHEWHKNRNKKGKLLLSKWRVLGMQDTNQIKSTQKLNWCVSTLTEVFIDQKEMNAFILFWLTKTYIYEYFICLQSGDTFIFFNKFAIFIPTFVLFLLHYLPFPHGLLFMNG